MPGKRAVVARRQHGDLVPAPDQAGTYPFGVDGEAADMRTIVRERREDPHADPSVNTPTGEPAPTSVSSSRTLPILGYNGEPALYLLSATEV